MRTHLHSGWGTPGRVLAARPGRPWSSWYVSKNKENAGLDRADRWGLFIGEWAPTFFALGAGLRLEEKFSRKGRGTELTPTITS